VLGILMDLMSIAVPARAVTGSALARYAPRRFFL